MNHLNSPPPNATFRFAPRLRRLAALGALTLLLPGTLPAHAQHDRRVAEGADQKTSVCVNREYLDTTTLSRFEQRFHCHVPAGSYWYDRRCGAWGREGGPTLGFLPAGLNLGGRLRADASAGDTGVFVNGRQLHLQDKLGLEQMGVPVQRGHWWLRANGDFGRDGLPFVLGNLLRIVRGHRGRAYGSVYSSIAGGIVTHDGAGNLSASFRNSDGSYSSYNSGD